MKGLIFLDACQDFGSILILCGQRSPPNTGPKFGFRDTSEDRISYLWFAIKPSAALDFEVEINITVACSIVIQSTAEKQDFLDVE